MAGVGAGPARPDGQVGGVICSERRPAAEEQRLRERIETFYLSGMKAVSHP